eukprot:scaffold4494_cov161-Amphora_coffeaeformis.AAC.1
MPSNATPIRSSSRPWLPLVATLIVRLDKRSASCKDRARIYRTSPTLFSRTLARDEDSPRSTLLLSPINHHSHLVEAVCRGVSWVTFDNAAEIEKCAAISSDIKLIMRIITDDRGSQCRLSSKFGAPRHKWRPLMAAAKQHKLPVVGVSFHVGSGCRDATRYELALKDAKEIFEMAEKEFGMKMTILDIGGGFPGETHSMWNPAAELDSDNEDDAVEGKAASEDKGEEDRFMFFTEIAEQVAPVLDRLFPEESGVRIIGEPGRYMVAASATLCCSVIANRTNQVDNSFQPEAVNDREAAKTLDELTRGDQEEMMARPKRSSSMSLVESDNILSCIQEELSDYSKLFASQQLVQQEVDVYTDKLDLYKEGFESSADLLGPPLEQQKDRTHHTVEGMSYPLVEWAGTEDGGEEGDQATALLTLAAAGEAAVNGVVMQAVCDSAPLQDDYAYYVNDGVYGAFNNIMFDHASVRPRVLGPSEKINATEDEDGMMTLQAPALGHGEEKPRRELFASTLFGPTCDSIDVIARSVLLPQLKVGDWLYFNNMGAYTMAAASSFNGFAPSDRFYVCSVQPEFFEALIEGPKPDDTL